MAYKKTKAKAKSLTKRWKLERKFRCKISIKIIPKKKITLIMKLRLIHSIYVQILDNLHCFCNNFTILHYIKITINSNKLKII